MAISPVSSNVNALNVKNPVAVQSGNQAARTKEVENDKDKDDGTTKAATQNTPRPSVNTSGQVVGRFIDIRA